MSNPSHLLENIFIFYNNLCGFYVFCVLTTIATVCGTLWWQRRCSAFVQSFDEDSSQNALDTGSHSNKPSSSEYNSSSRSYDKLGIASSRDLLDSAAALLTPEDLVKEKEIEQKQLANIFELLQKEKDKFQIGSIEEVEEQLKLYRS